MIGGLIQPVGVAWAIQNSTAPPLRRNLRLMLNTVPMRQSLRNELRFARLCPIGGVNGVRT